MNLLEMERIRGVFADPAARDAVESLANSPSLLESNLSISALREVGVPDRDITLILNLRSFLVELGSPPLRLGADFGTLSREGGVLARVAENQYAARFTLPCGEILVLLSGEGNGCDMLRFVNGFDVFPLACDNPQDGIVHPSLLLLVMEHPQLLRELQMLYGSLGLVFNPRSYNSPDSFIYEHITEATESLAELF